MQDIIVFFIKGFARFSLGAKEDNAVTLPHISQRKHAFTGKIQDVSNTNPAREKIALELLHKILGHR